MSLFTELKRRNVLRVAAAYIVLSWLLIQIADTLGDTFGLPDWSGKLVVMLLIIGFVPAMIFSWVYELTPEGLRKESTIPEGDSATAHTARKLDVVVIALLLLALGVFAFDRWDRSVGDPVGEVAETSAVEPERAAPAASKSEDPEVAPSVAVLPFTTRSREADDVFFSDGIHDDLLTQLAKIGDLRVISRTSVMDYRNSGKRIPEIASELGVASIVEGAVQRSGQTVRITAQLIDAESDEHLWAETYDRELTAANLFAIQTEIATSIARALQATLSPEERARVGRRLTDDLEALEAYQRARTGIGNFRTQQVEQAIADLGFAIARDPDFAAAYALRARNYLWRYWIRAAEPELRERARADIEKARALAPDLPEVDIAEGIYHYWGFLDYEKALAVLEPALDAYPNDADLMNTVAWVNRRYGRFDTALEYMRQAIDRDPRNINALATLGETRLTLGDYAGVEAVVKQLDALTLDHPRTLSLRAGLAWQRDGEAGTAASYWRRTLAGLVYGASGLWYALMADGQYAQAADAAELVGTQVIQNRTSTSAQLRGLALYKAGDPAAEEQLNRARDQLKGILAENPGDGATRLALCQVLGAMGDRAGARASCERALEDVMPDAYEHYRNFVPQAVGGLAMAGERDRAFELLQDAIGRPAGPRLNNLALDPFLEPLHEDPRWTALLEEAPL